jgi:tRNA-2-methylthio-N6-dimethylallyladenosine synthase
MEMPVGKNGPSVFIETYGCQMNKYDSELIAGLLIDQGCTLAGSVDQADVVLINTCSVRDHAEKRVFGRIGTLSAWKKRGPGRKLGIVGCMAQRIGRELLDRKPVLDFAVGPDDYRKLPGLLKNGFTGPSLCAALDGAELYEGIRPERAPGVSGWIAVSRGCDNGCSYCIVPRTRGPERSRPMRDILDELGKMTSLGYREVVFLGQNVNAYRDGRSDFADLLVNAARLPALKRIRFMTSHPKDLSDRLLLALAAGGKLCPHIHLPVQSGSDRILDAMNRGYSRGHYLRIVDKARKMIAQLSVTTDVLVGFPGETEADFADTCSLLAETRFDEAYTYAYSPRAGTPAAGIPENLTAGEKRDRLDEVIRLQHRITLEIKKGFVGSEAEILPEGPSRRSEHEWMGKTPSNHVVVFPKPPGPAGETIRVRIEKCVGATLWGNRI